MDEREDAPAPLTHVLVEYEEYDDWRIIGVFSSADAAKDAAPNNARGLRNGRETDQYGDWGALGDPNERRALGGFWQTIQVRTLDDPSTP